MTNVAPLFSDPYRQRFAEFMTNRREPDAIARVRRAAFERFEALGLPTRQQEAWRLTDLSALQAIAFQCPCGCQQQRQQQREPLRIFQVHKCWLPGSSR